MFLTKDGVTFDVKSPLDVARLKKAGYVEEIPAEKPVEEKPTKKAEKVEKPVEEKGGK